MENSEVASDISVIESTPGFLLPDEKGQLLRDVNRPEYDRLEKKRDAAYQMAAGQGPETTTEAPPESNVVELEKQNQRITAAQAEGKLLEELGFDVTEIPLDISAEQLEYMKMQRLAAQENYTELYPMMGERIQELPPENQGMVNQFIGAKNLDPILRKEVTESILGSMNRARKRKE